MKRVIASLCNEPGMTRPGARHDPEISTSEATRNAECSRPQSDGSASESRGGESGIRGWQSLLS